MEEQLTPAIVIEDLFKSYGKKQVLKGLNLTAYKGEMIGFIGRNGVGKSTTIDCIIGAKKYDKGKIIINGYDNVKEAILAKYFKVEVKFDELLTSTLNSILGVKKEIIIDRFVNDGKEVTYDYILYTDSTGVYLDNLDNTIQLLSYEKSYWVRIITPIISCNQSGVKFNESINKFKFDSQFLKRNNYKY